MNTLRGKRLRLGGVRCIFASLLLLNCVSCGTKPPAPSDQTRSPNRSETAPATDDTTAELAVLNVLPDGVLRGFATTGNLADLRYRTTVFAFPGATIDGVRTLTDLATALADHAQSREIRLVVVVENAMDAVDPLRELFSAEDEGNPRGLLLVGTTEQVTSLRGIVLPEMNSVSAGISLVDFYGRVRKTYEFTLASDLLTADMDAIFAERLLIPGDIADPPWLDTRRRRQLTSTDPIRVFHDFQFTDKAAASGITFRNKIVDDAGRLYEAAHYDHGNGIVSADVDADGHWDTYFLTQAGPNELWRNLGDGRFENITTAATALDDRISVTASFGDIDNDGDPDLFVTTVRHGNVLLENAGDGGFRDITETAGVLYVGHSSAAVFFDYNPDGRLDLFVCNVGVYTGDEVRKVTMQPLLGEGTGDYEYYRALPDAFAGHLKPEERNEQSILYRNEGGNRFRDVTEEVGLVDVCWSGDASPCDFNNDGRPDLYLLNMQGHDEYYENVDGTRFERRSADVFPNTPWGTMGVKVFDFNNDGLFDLYLTDMHSDMSEDIGPEREKMKSRMRWPPRLVQSGEFNLQPGRESIYGNAFYRNVAEGGGEEVSDVVNAETYWPWGLSVGDVNGDGFDDAFVANSMNFPFRYSVNSLLLNERGTRFRDSEFVVGVEPRPSGRTAMPWFELDCANSEAGHRLCEEHNVQGWRMVWSALGTKSSVILDIDSDGDLDIVTNEVNTGPMVLVSNLSDQKPALRYISVQLRGSVSNRDGLGAIVTVKAGGMSYRKVYDGVSGYLSHSLCPLYFGLDTADVIDSIEVVWPSGTKQILTGPLETNRRLVIQEEG